MNGRNATADRDAVPATDNGASAATPDEMSATTPSAAVTASMPCPPGSIAAELQSPVEIERWLRETRPDQLQRLWQEADAVRRQYVGDAVHLRGLIEISNICVRSCAYCGVHRGNHDVQRYRMTAEEILQSAGLAAEFGYGTVVMQGGEDYGIEAEWMADIIRAIKSRFGLAVTLSLGERTDEEFALWRAAGADRYLLRFETSDRDLYRAIHPDLGGRLSDRIAMLRRLQALGYEVGSGVMIGLPGQSFTTLANDICLFRELHLHMIGVGPYIPHPKTALAQGNVTLPQVAIEDRPVADETTTCKVVALARLVCPDANIPATTALATISGPAGRIVGLARGANIIMPNVTPAAYRRLYEIYPAKASSTETPEATREKILGQLQSIGRPPGRGHGGCTRRSSSAVAHPTADANATGSTPG